MKGKSGNSCSNHKNLEDCLSNHNKKGEPCGWTKTGTGSCNSPTYNMGRSKRTDQIYLCGEGEQGIGYDINLNHDDNGDDYDYDDNGLYVPNYGGKKSKRRKNKTKRKTKRRRKKIKRKTKRRRKKIKRKTKRGKK